jgi:hypothetical protein
MKIPGFIGPSYTSISRAINAQRLVNMRLELDTANGKSPVSLVGLPGYTAVIEDLPAEPVRGFWKAAGGRVFVAVGAKVYELFADLTHTERGTLPTGAGLVTFADNGLQLLAVDGVGVLALTLATNVATNAIANFPPGATHVVVVDNTFLANEGGTQRIQYSAVGNGLSWDSLDVISAEALPDEVVAMVAFGRQVFVQGASSFQQFWNSGDASRPFVPVDGSTVEVGCIAPASVAKDEAGVYWLGGDERGGPRVYRASGGQVGPVSTPALDSAMTGSNGEPAYVLEDAQGYTFRMDGHVYYVLTFPSSKKTWVYDAVAQAWSEYLEWTDGEWFRHRSNCAIFAFGRQLIGDFANGKIYELSPNVYDNDGAPLRALRSTAYLAKDESMFNVGSIEVLCEQGVGLTTGQGSDPQMMLRVSKDGGNTWTGEMLRPIGKKGEFKDRARFIRPCGNARSIIIEVSITDPVKRVITGGLINGV